jgi:starch phosphorylase
LGKEISQWKADIAAKWSTLQIGEIKVETIVGQHVFEAQIILSALEPEMVRVELYADHVDEEKCVRQVMVRGKSLKKDTQAYLYHTQVPATRPVSDFTVRIIPQHPNLAIPLEATQILWQT